jgi:3-oxoacyl-[acyl-carrier-protein] synthase-3
MKNIEKEQKECNASAMKKASEELESFAFKLEETREKSFMLKSIVKMVEELENGKIKDDDVLVLVGFGGGLTWGAVTIRWGK